VNRTGTIIARLLNIEYNILHMWTYLVVIIKDVFATQQRCRESPAFSLKMLHASESYNLIYHDLPGFSIYVGECLRYMCGIEIQNNINFSNLNKNS